jgi:hypothetical protein
MNEFLKFYQNKPLNIKINDTNLEVKVINLQTGIDVMSNESVNVITVHIVNKEDLKNYLHSMVGFHLKKELKRHLSLFSIDGDLTVSLV